MNSLAALPILQTKGFLPTFTAMGGQHKKKLRAEKAKVKLKGAKLPKGLNVTKTEFKVRKIVIREQLKESKFIEGQRQISLKDTLSRLKHHSSSFRLDALRTLRESILGGQTHLLSHLSEIIQSVSAISLDMDKETRRESFKTLGCLMQALQATSVAPFFHIISSYLRCAMTHIQTAIQEDALLMLDVLLEHVPHLVATHSEKIFQNFLEMISRVRAEGDRAGRTLTVQMGQSQTTIKWRSKVLQRLQQMLKTQAEHSQRNASSVTKQQARTFTFNNSEPQHFSLKRTYIGFCDISSLFNRSLNDAATAISAYKTDGSTMLTNYIEHLMPLLLESWLEVRPPEAGRNTQTILSNDAAFTLEIILEIIANLWALVDIHEAEVNNQDLGDKFRKDYGEPFALNFLQTGFPYQQVEVAAAETSKKRKKSVMPTGGQFCVHQNLSLVMLMCRFFEHQINEQPATFCALLEYLNAIVSNAKPQSSENQRHLVAALRAVLLVNGHDFLKLQATQTRQLLNRTIAAFLGNQFTHKDGVSAKLLVVLCGIVQHPTLFSAYGTQEFLTFLEYLPQLLLRPTISEAALLSMCNLGKQRNAHFLGAIEKLTAAVIKNIQAIQVTGAINAFEGKKLIMNLFFWIHKNWNEEEQNLLQLVEAEITDKRMVGYFKFILTYSGGDIPKEATSL